MTQLTEAAEFFSQMPITALAAAVDALGYEDPANMLQQMLALQRALKLQFEARDNARPFEPTALFNLAYALYVNNDDLQINVDPIEFPFDTSEAEDATWVRAWVRLPADQIETEIERLTAEQAEKAQALIDLEEQEIALFGERGVDRLSGGND
jgi:hypothetical protein